MVVVSNVILSCFPVSHSCADQIYAEMLQELDRELNTRNEH